MKEDLDAVKRLVNNGAQMWVHDYPPARCFIIIADLKTENKQSVVAEATVKYQDIPNMFSSAQDLAIFEQKWKEHCNASNAVAKVMMLAIKQN